MLTLKNILKIVLPFVLTIILFDISLSIKIIDPTNIRWIMDAYHDWGTHYLGWSYFRFEPWSFPLGDISNYNYPVGTNVGYTDSIPILAIIFKLFTFILPENFQYLGLWMFVSYLLLAFYTLKILDIYKINLFFSLVVLSFVLTNPVLIFRAMHPALFSHWIIVACIYFYLKTQNSANIKSDNIKLIVLIILSSIINPYIFAMVFGFSIIIPLKQAYIDKHLNPKKIIIYPIIISFVIVVLWFIIGIIRIEPAVDMNVGSKYGIYALNLNSLVNSFGFSNFLPSLNKVSDYQYEGYMYLGLGMISLIIISLLIHISFPIRNLKIFKIQSKYIPLFVLSLLLSLFAVTGTITFGQNILFELQLPKILMQIGDIFRASARFFWLSYYLILFSAFLFFFKNNLSLQFKYIILSILLVLQLIDIKPILTYRNLEHGVYKTHFQEASWSEIIQKFDVICTYPPFENHLLSNMDYQDLDYLALKQKKPITNGYVARDNIVKSNQFKTSIDLELLSEINPEYLFVTTAKNLEKFRTQFIKNSINITYLDGYFLIYSKHKILPISLIAENKTMCDSIKKVYNSQSIIQNCKSPTSIESNLIYNFESIYYDENVLKVSGWSFIENINNSIIDSVFIVLKNNKKCFRFKANKAIREDLNPHFNRKDLDNAGFDFLVISDSLVNQKLQLSIAYTTIENKLIYCPTSKWINDEIKPKESKYIYSEDLNIKFNVENILLNDEVVEISGWAFISNQKASEKSIKLIFATENNIFEIETEKINRHDVTDAFKSKYNLDNSGFELKFNSRYIAPAIYQIGILVYDSFSKEYKLIKTDRKLILGP